MNCSRCGSDRVIWNTADYLVCMNCGRIIIEPTIKSEIVNGLMLWATGAKEKLWKLRCSEGNSK